MVKPEDTIGERIRKIRKRLKITERQLGERTGVTMQTISFIEIGRHKPSLNLLMRISEELGTTTDYLLKGAVQTEDTIRNAVLKGIRKDLARIEETLKQLKWE